MYPSVVKYSIPDFRIVQCGHAPPRPGPLGSREGGVVRYTVTSNFRTLWLKSCLEKSVASALLTPYREVSGIRLYTTEWRDRDYILPYLQVISLRRLLVPKGPRPLV